MHICCPLAKCMPQIAFLDAYMHICISLEYTLVSWLADNRHNPIVRNTFRFHSIGVSGSSQGVPRL